MTQKDKMLHMVLNDPKLREAYDYSIDENDTIYDALNSSNAIVVTVAKIIKELNGSPVFVTFFRLLFNGLNSSRL